jgi:hypothetical protein
MIHNIVSATYAGDYKIEIKFDDGERFEINKELGVLSWQNEVDIAPETLYAETTGSPLPDWMDLTVQQHYLGGKRQAGFGDR